MITENVYSSKVDLWLVLFLVGTILFIVYPLIGKPEMLMEFWPTITLGAIILLFFLCIVSLYYIKYIVRDHYLYVKIGPIQYRSIDILSIKKIEETRSILSSPAASLDRLEITYNKFDSIIISPQLKQQFISDLINFNKDIKVKYRK